MLHELRVENLGIIEEILVPLGPGMTVITGETGAGKTLLVDALELLCGGRADPTAVREGAEEARVEGRFTLVGSDDPDEVVLARVIPVVGRSRGYVNGRLATASELAEWGRRLVDLHGQHAHQSLLAPVEQRALLDRASGDRAATARARECATRAARRVASTKSSPVWVATNGPGRARSTCCATSSQRSTRPRSPACTKPRRSPPRPTSSRTPKRTARPSRLRTRRWKVRRKTPWAAAAGELAGRAPFSGHRGPAARVAGGDRGDARARSALALESVVIDPERLAGVQDRRARLQELTRKYGPGLAEVLEYRAEIATRLEELESHDARAAALDAARAAAVAGARRAATDLSALRKQAAGPLAAAVTDQLRDLAMPKATFAVELTAAELSDDGADDVMFVLAPNPGEPPRPLARAASGGELSRAMLALRVVLSEAPPTLVFDEVDAGIGGEAGSAVGRALAGLGGHHQVLCVTHLPQVAAFADAHVAVSKSEQRGRTPRGRGIAPRRRPGRRARADARG